MDKVALMLTDSAAVVALSPSPQLCLLHFGKSWNVADYIPVLVSPVSSSGARDSCFSAQNIRFLL